MRAAVMFSQTNSIECRKPARGQSTPSAARLGAVSKLRDARSMGAVRTRARKGSWDRASMAAWCATLLFLSSVLLIALGALAEITQRLLDLAGDTAGAVRRDD
jgi:hypothetical protein